MGEAKEKAKTTKPPYLDMFGEIPTKVVGGRIVADREAAIRLLAAEGKSPRDWCGFLAGGPSLTKALLEDRRREREKEDRDLFKRG